MKKITLDSHGRLGLPGHAARRIGERPLELTSHSERHLLLVAPGDDGEVILAGTLGEVSVPDLLSFCNMFRRTGLLRFDLAGGAKELFFEAGEVVYASSTFPEEDLGEVLYDLGKVDRESLQRARQFATGSNTVGKILVDKGGVTPKDLWTATRSQVERIVYNLFAFHGGGFSFVSKDLAGEEIVRLPMSTQNLIMEGLRRLDERALFMRRIGSLDAVPVADGEPGKGLSPAESSLFKLVAEGQGTVRELLRRSGAGEFEGLRLLFQLLEKEAVRLEDAPPVQLEGVPGEILAVYNGVLSLLYRRLVRKDPGFDREVAMFLRDLPQPLSYVLRDVTLREDGSVDGGRIMANLAGLEEGDQEKLLAESLGELVFMECAAARRELESAEAAELTHRVQEISRRVKSLVGSKR
ncbi:DUF4388 domain-containing protein [uncultured Desulfuromonas sp.]|uniref:DUF4388 domain-containing protein n=1 Tax=uncultured Desulfuromonas sp. TaxID=181013 RepID=UPI002624DA00|nr:DUF4388 domain-containing protein [uncultured Desulfuromonas sp.]